MCKWLPKWMSGDWRGKQRRQKHWTRNKVNSHLYFVVLQQRSMRIRFIRFNFNKTAGLLCVFNFITSFLLKLNVCMYILPYIVADRFLMWVLQLCAMNLLRVGISISNVNETKQSYRERIRTMQTVLRFTN